MITKLRIPLVATFSPVAWKTTSALDPAARAIRDGADALASVATVRGVVKKTDMGALKNGQRRAIAPTRDKWLNESGLADHECPDETFVLLWVGWEYVNGINVTGTAAGCDGKCCVGYQACDDFAGCIKRDGSCMGEYACAGAYSLEGIEASCDGDFSCYMSGSGSVGEGGSVGKVSNSCNGNEACYSMGSMPDGSVGTVSNSCNGGKACYKMGYEGSLGTVDNSCNADGACKRLAFDGTIRSIAGSCNSEKHLPCLQIAGSEKNLVIGDITAFKRNWRVGKIDAENIEACSARCEEKRADDRDDCSGIKWRQGADKPCRIFKGGFTEGKCHDKDLCITV